MSTTETVTVKDIAQRASVSVGTVSRVFHNHSNVGNEIRERVLQAAADLGYKKAIGQRTLQPRSRMLKEIGFLYCSSVDSTAIAHNPFWLHILNGVEKEALSENVKVSYAAIHSLMQTPQVLITTLQAMKLDGILLVGPAEKDEAQLLKALHIPLVLVDNHVTGLSLDSVLCDNFAGASLAVEYLLRHGHRQIAFIGGPLQEEAPRPLNSIYTLERRSAGYRTTLLDAGLPIDYHLFEASDLLYPANAAEACQRLLARNVPFTAVFCANDEIAIGVIKALREAGKRVPEDVSVIGFDDIPLVEHLSTPLTTIRVNKEALGAIAFKTLRLRAADPQMPAISTVLEVELVERESVSFVNPSL